MTKPTSRLVLRIDPVTLLPTRTAASNGSVTFKTNLKEQRPRFIHYLLTSGYWFITGTRAHLGAKGATDNYTRITGLI